MTRSNFRHRDGLVVIGLVILQLAARQIESFAYTLVVRRVLLRNGAQPCDRLDIVPVMVDCDLVTGRRVGNRFERTTYSHDGATKITDVFIDGVAVSSSRAYWGNLSRLILPFAAVVAGLLATARKMFRTGAFFTWRLSDHPWDEGEKRLLLYAIPVFITGLLQLALIP